MPDKDNFGAVLQPVGYRWQNDRDGLVEDGTAPACRASAGSSGFHKMNHPVVVQQPVPYDLFQITAPVNRQNRKPGDPCHTLARDNAAHAAVAFANRTRDGIKVPEVMADGIVPALTNPGDGGRSDAINVAVTHAVAPTITAANDPSRSPQSSEVTQQVAAVHAASMTVRRLTPRECERLQGFPDDWTLIPWRKKPADECPDGPRYKALGNSMAVNCMAWIGERIAVVEELQ